MNLQEIFNRIPNTVADALEKYRPQTIRMLFNSTTFWENLQLFFGEDYDSDDWDDFDNDPDELQDWIDMTVLEVRRGRKHRKVRGTSKGRYGYGE